MTEFIRQRRRVTAQQVAEFLGCTERNAYRILDLLAEVLGLYKDGKYYVWE